MFKEGKMAQNLLSPHFWLTQQTPTKNDQVKGIIKRKKEKKEKKWLGQSKFTRAEPQEEPLEMEV